MINTPWKGALLGGAITFIVFVLYHKWQKQQAEQEQAEQIQTQLAAQ